VLTRPTACRCSIEILADSLNYGYSGHAWRVLDAVNGCHVKDLAQLAEIYRTFKGEYFVFEFAVVRFSPLARL
jgi:hypothetical protein